MRQRFKELDPDTPFGLVLPADDNGNIDCIIDPGEVPNPTEIQLSFLAIYTMALAERLDSDVESVAKASLQMSQKMNEHGSAWFLPDSEND